MLPNAPVLIPEVAATSEERRKRGEAVSRTTAACRAAAGRVAGWKPKVIVLISPHMENYADYFHLTSGVKCRGDLEEFGLPDMTVELNYDVELRDAIIRQAEAAGIPAGVRGRQTQSINGRMSRRIDQGSFVPLHFITEQWREFDVVRIGVSGLSPLEHYRFGQCIRKAINDLKRRAVIVASGDLSHRMTEDGPEGFAPEGPQYDSTLTSIMISGNFMGLLTIDPDLCEKAGECGLRCFQIMAGILDGAELAPALLSYECPFGIGYAVATFTYLDYTSYSRYADRYVEAKRKEREDQRAEEDPWVRLARLSVEARAKGEPLRDLPEDLPGEMKRNPSGVFVSIYRNGELRGCVGTIRPVNFSVGEEIMEVAGKAAFSDPRFAPVQESELEQLDYTVDVVGRLKRVASEKDLNVERFGVLLICGGRQGVALPGLEGVENESSQIALALRNGNIREDERYVLYRFPVVRHRRGIVVPPVVPAPVRRRRRRKKAVELPEAQQEAQADRAEEPEAQEAQTDDAEGSGEQGQTE